jgi:parvulin-like peptidyl-prolyl isomerase
VLDELDQLVMERMIELEAARHGSAVEPEEVEQAFERAVATITRELVRGRPGTTLDEYVRRSLGLDPATYRERLRRGARRALLGERVFRTHLLTSEHAWARMIVVREEEQAETIRRELERGGDFASLARTHSIDGEEEERGQPVPVVKGDTLMSRLVFQTPLGEVAGPVLEQGAYLLVKVEQRPEPLAGGWPDVRAAVEASLAATPVQELEITQWKVLMLRRYDADLSPFLRLAGEPEPHEER